MLEPKTASSGKAALAVIQSQRTDVVLSALHLDDIAASQLAETVFADPALSHVGFVIATSARDAEALILKFVADPRIIVHHKPFDQQQLADALQRARA